MAMLTYSSLPSGIGYYIFRKSNSQKNQFRRDPTHPSVASQLFLYFSQIFEPYSLNHLRQTFSLVLFHMLFLYPTSCWIYQNEVLTSEVTCTSCTLQDWRPLPQQQGNVCWCLAGGVSFVIPITSVTCSWPWPGPCHVVRQVKSLRKAHFACRPHWRNTVTPERVFVRKRGSEINVSLSINHIQSYH